jgi:hypothetical protein
MIATKSSNKFLMLKQSNVIEEKVVVFQNSWFKHSGCNSKYRIINKPNQAFDLRKSIQLF